MSDFNSSLPVRTQTNGDVVAKIVDYTTNTQGLGIDATGRITVKLDDGSGNAITSITNGSSQALSTIDQANGPVTPGTVAGFSELIGGQYNSTLPNLTTGQQAAIQVDSHGRLLTTNSNFPTTVDTNYGVVGANTIRTAAQIGNATGAADFNAGATGAQTLRVSANQGAPNTVANAWPILLTNGTNTATVSAGGELLVTVATALPAGSNNIGSVNQGTSPWIVEDLADGSVTGGTAGTFSQLAGGIYNSTPPTLTTGQQAALQLTSAGALIVSSTLPYDTNFGTVGANTLRTASEVGNATGAADFNWGTVGAQTLRVAAEVGNATGAADFNNGATGAQTLRVAANLAVGGANVSITNPIPVTFASTPGTSVHDYKDANSIAAGSTDNHQYTALGATGFYLDQIVAAGSGKVKMVVSIETGVATNVFTPLLTQFNSTATPNLDVTLNTAILVPVGVRVQVAMTNNDLAAQDLYSTILGYYS